MQSRGAKLEKKMSTLADTASKESLQTLARWIGFNRKHATTFCSVFLKLLKNPSLQQQRQWLYWQLIHEVLVLHANSSKWDRTMDLRTLIGETTIIPACEAMKDTVSDNVTNVLLKQWDEHNVFGGPTLVTQIRSLIIKNKKAAAAAAAAAAEKASKQQQQQQQQKDDATAMDVEPAKQGENISSITATAESAVSGSEAVATSANDNKNDNKDATTTTDTKEKPTTTTEENKIAESTKSSDQDDLKPASSAKKSERRISLSSIKEVTYDFESKGIPYGKVDAREFLDPCKAIATLQIARDLRNDGNVQLSSLLSDIPQDIKDFCQEQLQQQQQQDNNNTDNILPPELSKPVARDFSLRLNEKLLDMDIEEQLINIRTFRDIVENQRKARERLIFLLVKSRCQFGANETAAAFVNLQEIGKKLAKRKELLSDAMELEGLLDFEATNNNNNNNNNATASSTTEKEHAALKLEPLSWYKPEGGGAEEETQNNNKKNKKNNNNDGGGPVAKKAKVEK